MLQLFPHWHVHYPLVIGNQFSILKNSRDLHQGEGTGRHTST